ncbi:MAG: TIGR03619 family F420-dependent LLM class oxidoreductase [Streptosporangiales bacterium]|nr:TIGR03619 family F420-dependent LLM class oxidoreductase [Streptosporangiales bacterium]
MKIGINILNFGPYADPESLAGWARLAEDEGFDFALISDHVAVTPDVAEQYPAPFQDPFALLAWLAGTTSRIELGTGVLIVPYRHPLLIARMAAGIDRLSGGRMILGVGVGWARQEFAALGVPYERRGARTDEYLDAIVDHWTHDSITKKGQFVAYEQVATAPAPARQPYPPIWVGGASPAAIGRAARIGDAWHPLNVRIDWLRDTGLPALRTASESTGRPVPALAPRIPLRLTDAPLGDDRLPGQGTLEQVLDDLDALAALGATHVQFDTYGGNPASLRPPSEDQRDLARVINAHHTRHP